jgi:hypothetical protein
VIVLPEAVELDERYAGRSVAFVDTVGVVVTENRFAVDRPVVKPVFDTVRIGVGLWDSPDDRVLHVSPSYERFLDEQGCYEKF